ncbi:MAG: type II secretion system GspH family protein [Heliobacteriaceae bacterium]|jgi:prepilin-type N-terminal cleavage/methylation domain-containing protein|nr:type II secretion system GspH family protein [Heliobacteriaceae bacterium]
MKKAFTLAEVLITLGIIGVVAALTMLSLINNIKRKELKTGFAKQYSVLQQVLKRMEYDRGMPVLSTDFGQNLTYKAFMEYFSGAKDCGVAECVPAGSNCGYYLYSGESMSGNLFNEGQFIAADGAMYMFDDNNYSGIDDYETWITVDVNGYKKKPNRWGYDTFTFVFTKTGQIFLGGAPETVYKDVNIYCSVSSSDNHNGSACAYYAWTDEDYWKNLP